MKVSTAWALACIGLSLAIGVACYVTKSGWPLLGFVFTPSYESKPGKSETE